ncbi:protein tyrosine phosphatase family protein [Dinoroseobacter sp. S76]|uniref:protein tyrosine phosphatase family protein n=1 Tax=Dinoroseobacter sp. S76 TaxID=3415124 RepID=UPI003C799E5F
MADLPHILNWRRVSPLITSSGQPSEADLAEIRDLGVRHILNLGPHDNKGALADEPGTVAALGMSYTYIPVLFDAPTEADFAAFRAALAARPGAPIRVHCIYNARVSAFFYRLAKEALGQSETAFARMESIWRPGGDWATFLSEPERRGQRNRYKGEDY